MSDPITYTRGDRTYRVYGVEERLATFGSVTTTLGDFIAARQKAAGEALGPWRGTLATDFGLQANLVLSMLVSLRYRVREAAMALRSIPDPPRLSGLGVEEGYARMGARIEVPSEDGTASAVTSLLRDYVTEASGQDGELFFLAARVTTYGMWADVTYPVPLSAAQQAGHIDAGVSAEVVAQMTQMRTDPVPIDEIIVLPDLTPDALRLRAVSAELNELTSAVAIAFDEADSGLLQLLADYPHLAGFVAPGGLDGWVRGDAALAVLLAHFDDLAGTDDGTIDRWELAAIADDEDLPPHLRAAAQHLIDSPTLFERLSNSTDWSGLGDYAVSKEEIETLLEMNASLRTIWRHRDLVDVADDDDGTVDGWISEGDLAAIADDVSLPTELRDAARWFLDNPNQIIRVGTHSGHGGWAHKFHIDGVLESLINQQAYAHDPVAAGRFVRGLPVVTVDDPVGLPVGLASDDGLQALANAALIDAAGDLVRQHEVIAHLPESRGGIRNMLITAHYAEMAHRMDAVINGDLAGDPAAEGHSGANWMLMAPWASNSVGAPIRGDLPLRLLSEPFVGGRVSQAAADGNQWIYNDIGGRYAALIELYEAHPNPSPAQLESFFRRNFRDGDGTILNGFTAYVAAIETTDPVRRQHLTFQANSLIAIHEQAGVQHHLERVSVGPDGVAVAFVDLAIAGRQYHVDRDLPESNLPNNHVAAADILDLDPGEMTAAQFSVPGGRQFRVSSGDLPSDAVRLPEISGVEAWAPSFPRSITEFHEGGAGVTQVVVTPDGMPITYEGAPADDPDSLEGSGANSWPDRTERMWYITRLFEQTHVDRELWQTSELEMDSERFGWLDPATGLR